MSIFPVSAAKALALQERMLALGLREEDIEEGFIRSGGHGGQHVNKVSTCVQLRHLPTGLEVKCQDARSQAMNRYRARVVLCEKLDTILKGEQSEQAKRIAKIRRQKARRSRRTKEKILQDKHHQSTKKSLRSTPPKGQDEQ